MSRPAVPKAGHLFGGPYQYVVAELASLRDPDACDPAARMQLGGGFMAGFDRCAKQARGTAGPKALRGASFKGVIFAHHLPHAGVALDLAIDINPVKQQHYMAGAGMPIVSPEAAPQRLAEGSPGVPDELQLFRRDSRAVARAYSSGKGRSR